MIAEWIERNNRDLLVISGILDTVIPIVSIHLTDMDVGVAAPLGMLLTVLAGLNTAYLTKIGFSKSNNMKYEPPQKK